MNRLTVEQFPKQINNFYYTTREQEPETKRFFVRKVEVSRYQNEGMMSLNTHADFTDYNKYQNWIRFWKLCYAKLSEDIRVLKTLKREYFKTEGMGSIRSSPEGALKELISIANALLRLRQQMKMANRFYMVSRKERLNNA